MSKVPVRQDFFPPVLRLSQKIIIPTMLHNHSPNIRAKDMGLTQIAMPQCHGWTPSDLGSCPIATFQTLRSGTGTSSFVTRDFRTFPESMPKNQTVYLHKVLQNIYHKGQALQEHIAVR